MAAAPITPPITEQQPPVQQSGADFMKEVGGFTGQAGSQEPPAKPGFWRTILQGAMRGLAGAKGATSFGGGAAGGAAGELAGQQQDIENKNEAAQTQSQIKFRDMQSAVAAANLARQDHEMHQADETHQAELDRYAREQVEFNQKLGISYTAVPNSGEAVRQHLEQGTANDPNGAHVPSGIIMSPSMIYVPIQDAENSPLKEYNYLQKMGPLFGLPTPSRADYMGAPVAQRRLMLEPVQNMVSGHGRDGQPLNAQQLGSQVAYMQTAIKAYAAKSDADPDVLDQGKRTLGLLVAQQTAQREMEDRKFDRQKELATARGESYGKNRWVSWVDDQGVAHSGFASEAPGGGNAAPAGVAEKSAAKKVQFDEMQAASSKMRDSINKMEPLDAQSIAKIRTAMREGHGILASEFKSLGMESLSPAQRQFVIWATQLNERALSLRGVAGMGQGAQDLRHAIQATLPSAGSGDKKTMLEQLDAFDNQVSILSKGRIKMPGEAKQGQEIHYQIVDGKLVKQ